jgi:hypothetical protein
MDEFFMRAIIFILLLFFISISVVSAEWDYKYNSQSINSFIQQNENVLIFRNNGITNYNTITKESENWNTLNKEMCVNEYNHFLKLNESTLLITSTMGIESIENGIISKESNICKSYPGGEARSIYLSEDNSIWTFNENQVYCYRNGIWNEINLKDSLITTDSKILRYYIQKLIFRQNEVWALIDDNTSNTNTYYNQNQKEVELKLAIIRNDKVEKTILSADIFYPLSSPLSNGPVSAVDLGDVILFKNGGSIFSYNGITWTLPEVFKKYNSKPSEDSEIFKDKNGLVWYIGKIGNLRYYPISYDPQKDDLTIHFKDSVFFEISNIAKYEDGSLLFITENNFFVYSDGNWTILKKENFGFDTELTFTTHPNLINGKRYIKIENSHKDWLRGTLVCLDSLEKILPLSYNYKFSKLKFVEVNKWGYGSYGGDNELYEPSGFETQSGYFKFSEIENEKLPVKLGSDGNLYFSSVSSSGGGYNYNYIKRIENDGLTLLKLGFNDKNNYYLNSFTTKGDKLYFAGAYYYNKSANYMAEWHNGEFVEAFNDSLSNTISILDTKTSNLELYDYQNSDLPTFHETNYKIEYEGFLFNFIVSKDTCIVSLTLDNEDNIWLNSPESLIKFNPNGNSEKYPIPGSWIYHIIGRTNHILNLIEFYEKSNELVFISDAYSQLWYFDIHKSKWDSVEFANTSIKGNLTKLKKLFDGSICASDDLGYLYRYRGKGIFEPINLNIFGKFNVGAAINDFCLGADGKFYLGTDIGLFINDNFTGVQENTLKGNDGISISPNPAKDYITVDLSFLRMQESEIKIFNIYGERVLVAQTPSSELRIDVSSLPEGIYFVRIGEKIGKFIVVR